MAPNKRFSVTLTFQFDVREDDQLADDKLHNYSAADWRANLVSILQDAGINEWLPSPLNNIEAKVVEA